MSTFSTANLPREFNLPKGAPPDLIAAIENAARDAFAHHGASAFEMSREAAIAHEVGHTIVATHEGLIIQSVCIFSRTMPVFGTVWGGWCAEKDGEWTAGPDTSAESDLSRARVIIAGLAGEAVCRLDKPGSSVDELALSQWIGIYAASKLDNRTLSDRENINNAYAQRLWHEQVWGVATDILFHNRDPFMRLVELLQQRERVKGGKLHAVLAQIRKITP
jgi:hypothetical protein